ncbi:MAG: DUF2244 domain-containing protein [Pseudomonadota bacterium]
MSTEAVYLDAVLAPNAPLSRRGFAWVMATFGALSLTAGLAFLQLGFFPILGFFGLDVLLVWLIFQASFRTQRQRTYVRVTADSLDLRHVDGRGRETSAHLPSGFARVEIAEPAPRRPGFIKLAASGKAYSIGKFLTAEERHDFAVRLKDALAEARRERF